MGPLPTQTFPHAKISPFGVIPKRNQRGKWRLILNLSAPEGASINDGIARQLCSLSYVTVDDIAATVLALGQGSLLAKFDIKSAYRTVPVHPDDRLLLGMWWNGSLYIDTTLPFGLRSAPKIFCAIADMVKWVIRSTGVPIVTHYIDDFIIIGPPGCSECQQSLQKALQVCSNLGLPVAPQKTEGPSTCMPILGIEVDTQAMELRLPTDKMERLKETLQAWKMKRSCTRRELESLIGLLSHACKVVRPGGRFLSALLELLPVAKKRHHHIRLNTSFKADVEWWLSFMERWNGISILSINPNGCPDEFLWSDASGSWGCGAIWHTHWLQISWHQLVSFSSAPIAVKEMLPIILAACIWGQFWRGCLIQCNCDNEAVVTVLNSGAAKDRQLAHMLHCLFFLQAKFNFHLRACHIPGTENLVADALSRNQMALFFSYNSQVDSEATLVPLEWPALLLDPEVVWTSQHWTSWFDSICRTPWLPQPSAPMHPPNTAT